MKRDTIYKEVCNIVAAHFKIEKRDLSPYTDFVRNLGADSVDMVTLLFLFEDQFGIILEYNKGVASISDIVDIIASKMDNGK